MTTQDWYGVIINLLTFGGVFALFGFAFYTFWKHR